MTTAPSHALTRRRLVAGAAAASAALALPHALAQAPAKPALVGPLAPNPVEFKKTLEDFIGIVSKYAAFLRYQTIPSADWVRDWLGAYADECADLCCYIDCYTTVTNPERDVIACGNTRLALIFSQPKVFNVYMHDTSRCSIVAVGTSLVRVRTKGSSSADIISKSRTAKVKIRKL